MNGPGPGSKDPPFTERPNEDGGFHRTRYDPDHDDHISWDTDPNGDYRPGSGHEDRGGRKINDWDRDDRDGGRGG